MGLHSHANQRDGNEKAIVDALLHIGASVVRLDKPCDLLVGYRGCTYLFEVKLPLGPRGGSSHSKLNEYQSGFAQTWRGQFDVIRSAEDAIEILTAVSLPGSEPAKRVH
jgi:hypothetical protein